MKSCQIQKTLLALENHNLVKIKGKFTDIIIQLDLSLANTKAKVLNKILKEKTDLPLDSKKKIKEVRRTLKNR